MWGRHSGERQGAAIISVSVGGRTVCSLRPLPHPSHPSHPCRTPPTPLPPLPPMRTRTLSCASELRSFFVVSTLSASASGSLLSASADACVRCSLRAACAAHTRTHVGRRQQAGVQARTHARTAGACMRAYTDECAGRLRHSGLAICTWHAPPPPSLSARTHTLTHVPP